MSREAGFSLPELCVASVVLAMGVLGALATAQASRRLALHADGRARVAEMAASRMAALGGSPCRAGSGEASSSRARESWSVSGAPVRSVRLCVEIPTPLGPRSSCIVSALLCPDSLP